jgi:glycosyltransferase involved in cell wall biosynthesis
MGDKLVSMVVPVYNGEQVIMRCLENILNQSLKEVEIIVVDDGSVDRTADVCKELSSKISNLKYVNQKNQGPGVARSTGLKHCSGEYIYFMDVDDEIDEKLLEDNIALTANEPADIIIFGYKKIETMSSGRTYEVDTNLSFTELTDKESIKENLIRVLEGGAIFAVWNKLFRREFIEANSITFPDIRRNEDIAFVMDCFKNAHSLKVNPGIYYYYKPEYSSSKYDKTLIDQHLYVYDKFYNLFDGWMNRAANKEYANKLFVLYFFHSIPFFIVNYDEKPVQKLREMFESERFETYLKKIKIGDSGSVTIKLGLMLLKLRSPILLNISTRIKLFLTKYFGKNVFRELIRSQKKAKSATA